MDKFIISGGKRLKGIIRVPGAKNSALPILAASIMLDTRSVIKDLPNLEDVKTSVSIIKYLGALVTYSSDGVNILYHKNGKYELPKDLCIKMRSSVLYLAPILYRYGKVSIFMPGGCNIGKRPIDIHLDGLSKMGADIISSDDKITIIAPKKGLLGTVYRLKVPSVGATQTLIMAGVIAKGVTVLHGCAKEPEVLDLIDFLIKAGADIENKGDGTLIIKGKKNLIGVNHKLIPDRIFASTILAGVNACGGRVYIKNYPHEYMAEFEKYILQSGCKIQRILDSLYVTRSKLQSVDITATTGYYPAFATDMGPLLSAAMANNDGVFRLKETVFENRFSYLEGFLSLGVSAYVKDNTYIQSKGEKQIPAKVSAKDLRAGAALVVLCLSHDTRSIVNEIKHIDRGYEALEITFSKLGADIRREQSEQ